jgi:hypothetical protein
VEGVKVYFEPDEERQYRAILSEEANEKGIVPNVELIKMIAEVLNNLAK